MRSAGERIGRLVVAIAFTICVGSLTARAQEEGPGEEESTDMELAGKILPTLSTFFAGDITFQGNEMGAFIEDIVQHGKNLSGIWLLAPNTMTSPIEIGPFKGHLTAKGKTKIEIKMTLPFPSDGLPHCKVSAEREIDGRRVFVLRYGQREQVRKGRQGAR